MRTAVAERFSPEVGSGFVAFNQDRFSLSLRHVALIPP